MVNKVFFILSGKNGATYIINTRNLQSIIISLNFYKALSVKSKVLKTLLIILSYLISKIYRRKLKNINEIKLFLNNLSKIDLNFNLDIDSSILISSTRDKVIVNHHNNYFQKFSFGENYSKSKNELKIYKLFKKSTNFQVSNFQVSNFFDEKYIQNKFCSFKLKNNSPYLYQDYNNSFRLVFAIVDFFKVSEQQNQSIYIYLNLLQSKLLDEDKYRFINQIKVFNNYKDKYGHLLFPLGLVHRDFKPWNIMYSEKILIYDFEEAIIDGPPLEDLFNYFVDPIIIYKKPQEIIKYIYSKKNIRLYNLYLNELKIEIDFDFFLNIYLVNRILFWQNENKILIMNKYIDLSNHLLANNINQSD